MSFMPEDDFEWGEQFRYTWVKVNSIICIFSTFFLFARWLAIAFVDIK